MVSPSKRQRVSCMTTPEQFSSRPSMCISTPVSPSECNTVSSEDSDNYALFETPECTKAVAFASPRTDEGPKLSTSTYLRSSKAKSTVQPAIEDGQSNQFATDSTQHVVFDQLCTMSAIYNPSREGLGILNRCMRWQLIAWMGEVCRTFKLSEFTYSLSVNYMDRILIRSDICMDQIQSLAGCCVLLAAKFYEIRPPSLDNMAYVCGQEPAACLISVEKQVLHLLDFRLSVQTPHGVIDWLVLKALRGTVSDKRVKRVIRYAHFALGAGLHDLYVARCSPASVAIAALFVSFAVARMCNKCLAEWTHLAQVAPAVAHTILACRSIVSRTEENASFLSEWSGEAADFIDASAEITLLLDSPLPTATDENNDFHQSLPFRKRKRSFHRQKSMRASHKCRSVEAPGYATTSCHSPLVVGRKRAKAGIL